MGYSYFKRRHELDLKDIRNKWTVWTHLSRNCFCKQVLRGLHCIRVQSRERLGLMARLPSRNTAISVPKTE